MRERAAERHPREDPGAEAEEQEQQHGEHNQQRDAADRFHGGRQNFAQRPRDGKDDRHDLADERADDDQRQQEEQSADGGGVEEAEESVEFFGHEGHSTRVAAT